MLAPRLSTGHACSNNLYKDRSLRGFLQGWLAPRLSTRLAPRLSTRFARSKALYKTLHEACSLRGYLRGSLPIRMAPSLFTRLTCTGDCLILGTLQDSLVPRLSTERSLQSSLQSLYAPRLSTTLDGSEALHKLDCSEALYEARSEG